ncbi:MAG: KEOPS complex subunit Pcc1, partial [Candidatus Bathyarchaeota archaeon]|nr:KEOPS complex subunit Pcc1 [Candidatus Bathyarchaeota archaeon]
MEAKIRLVYKDAETACAIAMAVSPDNLKAPKGVFVETAYDGNSVLTEIRCEKSLATFISTIDDLLFSV